VFSVTAIASTKTHPTVERIAHFADRAGATHLQPDARGLLKRNILDSLGCAWDEPLRVWLRRRLIKA
jgi:hypothetical protein